MHRTARIAIAAAALFVCLSGTAFAGGGLKQNFFLSPSRNISCEIDYTASGGSHGLPNQVFCETISPARSVTLSATGRIKLCTGTRCIGDPPENAEPLAYGKSVALGPFTCSSLTAGMRCSAAGASFLISRSGVQRG